MGNSLLFAEDIAASRAHFDRAMAFRSPDGNLEPPRARDRLRHRHSARVRYARNHWLRGQVRLRHNRPSVQRRLSALRRSQAGSNPHQSASADEGRERRAGRASWRVRVEGDQAAYGGVQRGWSTFDCKRAIF